MTNPLKKIIRDFSLAIDGVVFRGDCDMVSIPEFTKKMDEYRGGGMDAPVEVSLGYEKKELEFELTAADPSVVRLIGIGEEDFKLFTIYAYTKGFDNSEEGIKIECQGEVKKLDKRDLKPGDKTKLKFTVAVHWYKETQGGVVVLEHDPLNLKMTVNGVDKYNTRRTLLGL